MAYLSLQDVNLYYEVKGTGKPIVLIHGMGLSHINWSQQVEFLTRQHYQTITIDIRGHGKSSETAKRYTKQSIIPQLTNDVYQLLCQLNVERTILMGYSTGTLICQQFAISYPHMVAGLFLSGAFPKISNIYLYGKFFMTMGLTLVNARKALARGVARSNGKDAEQIKKFEQEAQKVRRDEAVRILRASLHFDCREQLKQLGMPIIVTYGGNERHMMTYRRDYLTLAPTAEVCLFPHVNHATLTKATKVYHDVMLDFIKSLDE